jgi:hypothetical protein
MLVISVMALAGLISTTLDGGRQVCDPPFFMLWGVSASYFVGDTVHLVIAQPSSALVVCHHLVALAALGFMFAFSRFRVFMMIIGLQEISTFFMFLRRVESLRSWKDDITKAFILTWIVFRGLLSPALVAGAVAYLIESVSAAAVVHLVIHVFFLICNVYWSYEIVYKLIGVRREGSQNVADV